MVIATVKSGGQETMKINGIKKIGGALLGLLLFCGITLISGTTAQAQYPTWNQDQYRREQRERERQAQIERERQARQQQGGWYDQYGNYHASRDYNNQNRDYNNQNGYNRRGRNSDGYGNQGGSYELRQTALNAGYNEGLKAGRADRRSGRYNQTR